jgi:hypothetical protein
MQLHIHQRGARRWRWPDAEFKEAEHPRGEGGKFTSNGEKFYHGTSSANLEQMKREGIKPAGQQGHIGTPFGATGEHVHVTSDPGTANRYANWATSVHEDPAVVEIEFPEGTWLEDDPQATLAHRHKGTIKPEWIKRIARNGIWETTANATDAGENDDAVEFITVGDKAAPASPQPSGFFTVTPLGPSRALTPEGFLHCRDVPMARTGVQIYGPGETPMTLGISGRVVVERDPEDVFAPEAIASLQGKPVVNDHPVSEDGQRLYVTTGNWRELAIGTVFNPHRGEGDLADFLVADLIIYDPAAITLIEAGKRELSVGYEAQYVDLGPGRGRQIDILCNHLALVDAGRCGPRCAIGDAMFEAVSEDVSRETCACGAQEEERMTTTTTTRQRRVTIRDRIRAAFLLGDQAGLEEALGEGTGDALEEGGNGGGSGENHVHVHLPGNGNGGGSSEERGGDNGAAEGGEGGEGGDPGELLRQAVTGIHQEMDEMWDAINSVAGGGQMADAYPCRDGRRGTRDTRAGDEFGAAPGNEGGRTILPGFEIEAPPGTQTGDARLTADSAWMEDSFADTIAYGEILAPGVGLPTFDAAAKPKVTFDALCGFRRKVMDLAWNQPETRDVIEAATGGRFQGAAKVPCDRLRDWFFAAGALQAQANDSGQGAGRHGGSFGGGNREAGPISNNTQWQAALDKYYAGQKPATN